jgi:glycosyltransferase involved in cell wall biosynthesis
MKDSWVIGLHHNWHDYKFNYNPLFDFSMAGEEDLKEVSGKKFPLLPMDACNFVSESFKPSNNEKFWDILYIARAVKFKKIPEFFECVKKMYNNGKKYRILFICPMPPYKRSEQKTVFYEIREVYSKLFNEEEQKLFTLLTMNYRYPFPLDIETLSHFYKSSKVFVHFADNERRCRVASQAWASGLPVVGMSCVGSLLPKEIRVVPYFYDVDKYENFDAKIIEAVENFKITGVNGAKEYFDLQKSKERLLNELRKIFENKKLDFDGNKIFDENLDLRLGRHVGLSSGSNRIEIKFEKFLDLLSDKKIVGSLSYDETDPEKKLESMFPEKEGGSFFSGFFKK